MNLLVYTGFLVKSMNPFCLAFDGTAVVKPKTLTTLSACCLQVVYIHTVDFRVALNLADFQRVTL